MDEIDKYEKISDVLVEKSTNPQKRSKILALLATTTARIIKKNGLHEEGTLMGFHIALKLCPEDLDENNSNEDLLKVIREL